MRRLELFLHHAGYQCVSNRPDKLVKFDSSLVGAVDIHIVIHNVLTLVSERGEYFFLFSHANHIMGCTRRVDAPDSITLQDNCWYHNAYHFVAYLIAVVTFPAQGSKLI